MATRDHFDDIPGLVAHDAGADPGPANLDLGLAAALDDNPGLDPGLAAHDAGADPGLADIHGAGSGASNVDREVARAADGGPTDNEAYRHLEADDEMERRLNGARCDDDDEAMRPRDVL